MVTCSANQGVLTKPAACGAIILVYGLGLGCNHTGWGCAGKKRSACRRIEWLVAVFGLGDAKPFVRRVGVIGCLALLREETGAVLHFKHVLRGKNEGNGELRWSGSELMRHE